MDRDKALAFCHKYGDKQFYQPIIFVPGIIEMRGKWHDATKLLAEEILADVKGKTILDIGCLHGFFLHEALRRGATAALGVDYDTVEIAIAEEINEIFEDGAVLVHDKLEDYTPKNSYDLVLMMNILHVLDNPREMLEKYLRVTNELLVVEHRPDHEKHFPDLESHSSPSPRSAGYRKLSWFHVVKSQ